MKALKGLLIYVGIVLAIIVGIAILLFAGMYFFPSFRVLGVGVVHGDRSASENVLLSDFSGYDSVELSVSSKNIAITVSPEEMTNPEIRSNLDLNVFGLAYDITEYGIVLQSAEVVDNILRVSYNVTEPSGLISYTGSNMQVVVPSDLPVNLNISTGSGEVKVIGGETSSINLQSLNLSSSSGDFGIFDCYHDSESETLNLQNLIVNTKSGDFDFSNIQNINVKNTIKVNGNNAKLIFNNLTGSMNIVGSGIKLVANHIKTGLEGFEFFCDTGVFKLDKLETAIGVENAIVTENSNIEIGEIIGETGIISTYGNIYIGTIHDVTMIKSEHGNVTINHANEDINITTEYGNINVKDYKRNGIFTSKRGNINVKNTGEYEDRVYTKIVNEDGEINVDNNINKLLVETTGKSKAIIIFRQIKGGIIDPNQVFEHRVNISNYGSASVYLPAINFNTPFKFKAYGNISGEISGLTPEYEGNTVKSSEDYQYYPIASEENKELCQQSCYFEFYGTITFKGYQNV